MKTLKIGQEQGLCSFLKADPIALAYQVLGNKVTLPSSIERMLVERLFKICGKPESRLSSLAYSINFYDNEAKATVADLAVRIKVKGRSGCGRTPSMDKNGLYAVSID